MRRRAGRPAASCPSRAWSGARPITDRAALLPRRYESSPATGAGWGDSTLRSGVGGSGAVSGVSRRRVRGGRQRGRHGLGNLEPLGRLVGRGQDLVGQPADVFDQLVALLPEAADLHRHLLGVPVRLGLRELRLALGPLQAALGLGPRSRGELVRRLVSCWRIPAVCSPTSSRARCTTFSRSWRPSSSSTSSVSSATYSSTTRRSYPRMATGKFASRTRSEASGAWSDAGSRSRFRLRLRSCT